MRAVTQSDKLEFNKSNPNLLKPQQLSSAPGILDELVAGLAIQEGNLWDNSFVPDVRDHLFESSVGSGGLDLVALNIQRGRDHGIKGFQYSVF